MSEDELTQEPCSPCKLSSILLHVFERAIKKVEERERPHTHKKNMDEAEQGFCETSSNFSQDY